MHGANIIALCVFVLTLLVAIVSVIRAFDALSARITANEVMVADLRRRIKQLEAHRESSA